MSQYLYILCVVTCVLLYQSRTSVELNGLTPYTVYRVRIAAETGGGIGEFTNAVQERTLGDSKFPGQS